MTEEEKLVVLWEIANEVANEDTTCDYGMGDAECAFCYGMRIYASSEFKHDDTCIVTKARALMGMKELEHE